MTTALPKGRLVRLPTVAELHAVFDRLNRLHFGGRLKARLEWSTRLRTTAGKCVVSPRGNVIRLATAFASRYPELLERLILHEMIHLVASGHGAAFRAEARRCGVEPGPDFMHCPEFAPRRPYRYRYTCPICGLEVLRRRTGRWYCRSCAARHGRAARLRLSRLYVVPGAEPAGDQHPQHTRHRYGGDHAHQPEQLKPG
ncbi:MAG: SprT family zinc-dependent metalloprotease [Bacillota bacterium]|nr:SprT family zinc-dependent metalloprotease [Bacillota bacterium]